MKVKLDKENPLFVSDTQNNDLMAVASFKLEVSGSEDENEEEDEIDGFSKVAIRRSGRN